MTTTYQPAPVLPAETPHEDTDTLFTPQELDAYERHRTRGIQQRPWWKKLGWAEIATAVFCVLPVLTACIYCGAHYSGHNTVRVVRVVTYKVRTVTHWKLESGAVVTTVSAPRMDTIPAPHMDHRDRLNFARIHTTPRLFLPGMELNHGMA